MDDLQPVEFEQPEDAPPPPSAVVRVFRNRFDQWRAGWRILVYLVVLLGVGLAVRAGVRLLVPNSDGSSMVSWAYSLSLAAIDLGLILTAFVVFKWFDRRPASFVGLGFERRWLAELAGGVAVGIVSTGGLTLVLVLSGMVSLELSPLAGEALRVMPRYLLLFTVAAAAEELVFRGYILQALAEGSRRWVAAVLTSLPFAVVHLDNPDVSVVGIANIFLVGILFSVIYFQTLRLWLPIGFHLSWNWAHGWLWGFDVSGIELDHRVFIATPHGPEVMTGGGFGLEGSLATTVLVVIVAVWLLARPVLRPTAELAAIWTPYPRGFGLPPVDDPSSSDPDGMLAATTAESQ
jgi:membrane protease YdiL (CAAX protease family)